jgi:glycosyltransferase involved in cell wall biosynthesis
VVGKHSLRRRHLALVLDHLGAGGVQKMALSLGRELVARGHRVDVLTCEANGRLRDSLPPDVRHFELERANSSIARIAALCADPGGFQAMLRPVLLSPRLPDVLLCTASMSNYLRRHRPQAVVAASSLVNLMALWSVRLAALPVRVLVSERNPPSTVLRGSRPWRRRYLPLLMARTYPFADAIVTVSYGVAADLMAITGLPAGRIMTIYNPVVGDEIAALARAPVPHPWFAPGQPPIVLACGRMAEQKDYPTLIRAFADLRRRRPARLVILGEANGRGKAGHLRGALLHLARDLGVASDVGLLGYAENPYAYMARATVFALSSKFEGFGNALVEAMACGCPVVSTDCPVGPREILDAGRYGDLVPVGDSGAMAAAIERVIGGRRVAASVRERAALFTASSAADAYLDALFGDADRMTAAA